MPTAGVYFLIAGELFALVVQWIEQGTPKP